jgi:beta-lactamase regulating signal transducer with metallopeptidase domain
VIAALLDHLWQSTLFAAVVALSVPLFRKQRAAIRFWLWFAASMKFLFPFALLTIAARHIFAMAAPAIAAPVLSAIRPVAAPIAAIAGPIAIPAAVHITTVDLVITAWAAGAISIALIFLSRWLDLRATLHEASPLQMPSPIPVKSAPSFLEPGLVGIWRPVILLPQGLVHQLTSPELASLLAHELSHHRRRDNLLAALHMLVEGLFWFHPLVWWIGRRLYEERERACDECVISEGSSRLVYAESILKICNHYVQSPLACSSGISGGSLEGRLSAIMTEQPDSALHPVQGLFLILMGIGILILPVGTGLLQSIPAATISPHLTTVTRLLTLPAITPSRALPSVALPRRPGHRAIAVQPAVPPVMPVEALATIRIPAISVNIVLDTRMPAIPEDDTRICRRPRPLSRSRLYGPAVCLTANQWGALRANHRDIGPDGRSVISIDYDKERADAGYSCVTSPAMNTSPTQGPSCF